MRFIFLLVGESIITCIQENEKSSISWSSVSRRLRDYPRVPRRTLSLFFSIYFNLAESSSSAVIYIELVWIKSSIHLSMQFCSLTTQTHLQPNFTPETFSSIFSFTRYLIYMKLAPKYSLTIFRDILIVMVSSYIGTIFRNILIHIHIWIPSFTKTIFRNIQLIFGLIWSLFLPESFSSSFNFSSSLFSSSSFSVVMVSV